MIADPFIEALVKSVRSGNLQLSLDHVVVHLKENEQIPLDVPVDVEQKSDRFSCLIHTTGATTLPAPFARLLGREMSGPITSTEKDFMRMEAKTPGGVTVTLEGIFPVAQTFRNSRSKIHSLDFQRIDFPATGTDGLNTEPGKSESEDNLFAIIPDVKLLILPGKTKSTVTHPFLGESSSESYNCFQGEVGGGQFCLEDEEGDLLVYFRRPLNTSVTTRLSSLAIFDGILKAFGYTHCTHPWPYFQQQHVDQTIKRWVKPPQKFAMDGLLPLSEGRLRHAGAALFIKAAEFFAIGGERAETFDRALWLLHSSNAATWMAFEVRILTLCSILEGLVKKHAGGNLGSNPDPWKNGIKKLGLKWGGWFENVYQSWKEYRNPLAHGFDIWTSSGMLVPYSRIFAAIYIIMAREMGFSGNMDSSMLENLDTVTLA
jgi:hypothetical protein